MKLKPWVFKANRKQLKDWAKYTGIKIKWYCPTFMIRNKIKKVIKSW